MYRLRLFGVGFALAVMLGVTACTSQGSDHNAPPLPKNVDLNHLVLPLDSFQLSDSQLARMDTEWGTLLTRCAALYGSTISYGSDYIRDSSDKSLYWGGPLGTLSKTQASTYGYNAPPGSVSQPAAGFYIKTPENVFPTDTSPVADLITYGRPKNKNDPAALLPLPVSASGTPLPDGGCSAVVQNQIGTPLISDLRVKSDLIHRSFIDSRTQKAIAAWASCMKSAGYSFERPQDAQVSAGVLTAAAATQAVTDVGCTEKSNWPTVFYGLLIGYQKQQISKDPQLFSGVLQSQQTVLKKLDALAAK